MYFGNEKVGLFLADFSLPEKEFCITSQNSSILNLGCQAACLIRWYISERVLNLNILFCTHAGLIHKVNWKSILEF